MNIWTAPDYKYLSQMREVTYALAQSSLSANEYADVLTAILGAWPCEDRGDRGEQGRPGEVAPKERDVDVPEV